MKYKKYIYFIVFILMLLVGVNGVNAAAGKTEVCYYMSDDRDSVLTLEVFSGHKSDPVFDKDLARAWVQQTKPGDDSKANNTEEILNWYKDFSEGKDKSNMTLPKMYKNKTAANSDPSCPKYVMVRRDKSDWALDAEDYGVFATNDESIAKKFVENSKKSGKFKTANYLKEVDYEEYFNHEATGEIGETFIKEKQCNYKSENNEAMVRTTVRTHTLTGSFGASDNDLTDVTVEKLGTRIDKDAERIINYISKADKGTTDIDMELEPAFTSKEAGDNPQCPEYIMLRTNNEYSSYGVFATNSKSIAEKFVEKSNATGEYKAWVLGYKNADGTKITKEQYYETFIPITDIYDPNAEIQCTQLFGDKTDDGKTNDVNDDGAASLAYMIDSILLYVRIIVPILIIVLGMIDLGKAVIAGKEDEMRKAQSTFIKRVLLGVVVFFIPLLVDIIMQFADIVWEGTGYSSCEFR